jgi:hypothetical protein
MTSQPTSKQHFSSKKEINPHQPGAGFFSFKVSH